MTVNYGKPPPIRGVYSLPARFTGKATMGKRKEGTPRSRVRSALRQVWLRSRERQAAIKREGGCCEVCGKKQSVAKGREVKLEVHHKHGVEWEQMIDLVYAMLLCNPDNLTVMCSSCHAKEHEEGI